MLLNRWAAYDHTFKLNPGSILPVFSAIPTGGKEYKRSSPKSATFHKSTVMARILSRNPTVVNPTPTATVEYSTRESTSEDSLLSIGTTSDLSDSIGTVLSGVQLSALTPRQLNELGSLVTERGVVFFRDQKITNQEHIRVSEHYGSLSERPSVRRDSGQDVQTKPVSRLPDTDEWHADGYVDESPASFSLLKIDSDQEVKGETLWVNQYGLYDTLSKPMKRIFDDLQTIGHTKNNPQPAVRTHPVTGLKALNIIPGLVKGLVDFKRKESDKLLEFVDYHIHSTAEHTIRFKWAAGTVAVWDNRVVAYKVLPGSNLRNARFSKTSVLGENAFFDSKSESREERAERIEKEATDEIERRRLIKARFNRTPLRRIIHRQLFGEDQNTRSTNQVVEEEKPRGSEEEVAIDDTLLKDAPIVEKILVTQNKPQNESQNEKTQPLVKIDTPAISYEKISPAKKFNETPLRRIIRRQVSGNNQKQWHQINPDQSIFPSTLDYKSPAVNGIQVAA